MGPIYPIRTVRIDKDAIAAILDQGIREQVECEFPNGAEVTLVNGVVVGIVPVEKKEAVDQ